MSGVDFYSPLPKPTVSQKKRRLRAALGDLKEYSDAPPAVRRLATAEEEEESTDVSSGERATNTTAPPPPFVWHGTQKNACGGVPPNGRDFTWNMNCAGGERMSISCLSDIRRQYSVESLQRLQDMYDGSPAGSPRRISHVPRTRSSPSSSKISVTPAYLHGKKSERCNANPHGIPERGHRLCCHCAQVLLSDLCIGGERNSVLQRRWKGIEKTDGKCKPIVSGIDNTHENTSNTTQDISRQSLLLFEPLALLRPTMFANSYPRAMALSQLKRRIRETHRTDKDHCKPEPTKIKRDVMSTHERHGVKMSPLSRGEFHHYTKLRGDESVLSCLTPRRKSTGSLMYYPTILHPPRRAVLRNSGVQQQPPQRKVHSRVFSLSRASSERTGPSPRSSSTFRSRHSEPIEWLQQYFKLPQSCSCNLPVFASVGHGGESGGEGHVGLVSAQANSKLIDNNSISSLVLTHTGSNMDTLPSCCDAPLVAFMDSSSFTNSSITTFA